MNKIILAALLVSCVQGFAQFSTGGASNTGGRGTVQIQATPTPTSAAAMGSAALPTSTTGINDSAIQAQTGNSNASQNAALIGEGMKAAGMAIIASCSGRGCDKPGWVMYGLGILAGIQANNHSGTAGGASFTGDSTYGGDRNGDYNNGQTVTGREPFDEGGFATNFNRDMANRGIKASYDPKTKTLKTPNGPLKLSDIGNQSAMAAAGFSKSDVDSAFAQLKDIEKKAATKYKVGEFGTEDGAGGGGGSKTGSDASGIAGDAAGAGANRDLASLNTKGAAQGLTKDYHGDPIGVANDSLFDMMTRRYQLKTRQDSFFNGTELVLQK
jgi:hypothetical protein